MAYDTNNIFAKIIRGEIPCKKIYEDDYVLAFPDIEPRAPIHILIIPKGAYISSDDFLAKATDQEIVSFNKAVAHIAREKNLVKSGYRVLSNHGLDAGQEVLHYHVHLFGGKNLGPMIGECQ